VGGHGHTGQTVANTAAKPSAIVEVVSGPKPGRGFIVQQRGRGVEPTNGWINHCRRLDHHHEVTHKADEGSASSATSLSITRATRPKPVV
jgi:hypothetical protein